jgi:hypothetical protein
MQWLSNMQSNNNFKTSVSVFFNNETYLSKFNNLSTSGKLIGDGVTARKRKKRENENDRKKI